MQIILIIHKKIIDKQLYNECALFCRNNRKYKLYKRCILKIRQKQFLINFFTYC